MNFKRWIVALLVLCMVLTVMPVTASAATKASGQYGENIKWTLDTAGVLTISGTGEMGSPYEWKYWDEYRSSIKKVVIENGVTSISSAAFEFCSALTSVSIPNSVTTIGGAAFAYCSALKNIVIPNSVTGIGERVFACCDVLEKVTLSNKLKELPFVTFKDCKSLTSITIPKSVTTIGNDCFSGCVKLKGIIIPENVQVISYSAFDYCESLRDIIFLGDAPTMYRPFYLVNAFAYYPANNETWTEDVMQFPDDNCEIFWIPVEDPGSVKFGTKDNACGANATWKLENGVLTISGSGDVAFAPWSDRAAEITKVVIADGVTGLCSEAFLNCKNMTTVTLPKNLKKIGVMAFANCTKLQSISIPDSVTEIGYRAFDQCDSLTTVKLPAKLKEIQYRTFYGCDNLSSINIPNGVTSIGESAFYVCKKLTSITIPASVTFVDDYAFCGCSGLKSIKFEGPAPEFEGNFIFQSVTATVRYPADLEGWDDSDSRAHYNCKLTWQAYCSGKHKSNNETVTKKATCTSTGTKTGVCSVCGVRYTKEIPVTDHTYDNGKITTAPTCTASGVKTFTCKDCGKTKTETVKALGHDYSGTPVFDLDSRTHSWDCSRCDQTKTESCTLVGTVLKEATPDTYGEKEYTCSICSGSFRAQYLYRIAGSNRWETALKVAGEMKQNLAVEKFDAIIIASGNDFADALAGSYLSTVKNAPILLAWGKGGKYEYLDTDNIAYIQANLAEGGTVYILGGTNAVPELYETSLAGFTVKRLGGANRFETNLLILAEAGVAEGSEVLVCTSTNFADSLSASATGKPILLVFNESGKLYGAQPEFLAGLTGCKFTVIGGENAVGAALAEAIGAYGPVTRLAGANRFETSVLVARKYFEAPEYAVLAYAWNYPDGLCGGALAYTLKAPLILTMTKYEAQAAEYVQTQQIEKGIVLGGETLISDDAIRTIFAMAAPEAAK